MHRASCTRRCPGRHRWRQRHEGGFLFQAGIAPAGAALASIDATPLVRTVYTNRQHHRAARAWLTKLGDQRITYTGAVSFAVMSALGCRRVLTFDGDFLIAGFAPWQPDR